ncbi:MAG: rRNA maturation RNase YbeY [Pseudomonadota bacterium]
MDRILNASGLVEAELSILLTDNAQISQLNEEYRGKNKVTDVLAFAFADAEDGHVTPELLGDVVVSVEQAMRQSKYGDLESEVIRLLVHGFCHLRGYDHYRPVDSRRMEKEEQRLLVALGI